MIDIAKFIVATLEADATFQALTGGTADDRRIYLYFAAAAEIDSIGQGPRLAYVTYQQLAVPKEGGGVVNPVYAMVVWSRDPETAEGVRDRVVALFHKQDLVTSTGRALWGKKVHENDSFQEQPSFSGKTLHFQFGWLAMASPA